MQFANVIKANYLTSGLKNFAYLSGTAVLRNNSFVLTGQHHFHCMGDFQSKIFVPSVIIIGVVLKKSLVGMCSCSEAFDKIGEAEIMR